MYTDEELEHEGLTPHRGEPVTAAVVQADHEEYRTLTPADLPGVTVLLDGRRITDPEAWAAQRHIVLGS
jgi:UDP-N-acetyl-D-mannosaminuronate dehydrogenase